MNGIRSGQCRPITTEAPAIGSGTGPMGWGRERLADAPILGEIHDGCNKIGYNEICQLFNPAILNVTVRARPFAIRRVQVKEPSTPIRTGTPRTDLPPSMRTHGTTLVPAATLVVVPVTVTRPPMRSPPTETLGSAAYNS